MLTEQNPGKVVSVPLGALGELLVSRHSAFTSCHSERSKESLIQPVVNSASETLRFAQGDTRVGNIEKLVRLTENKVQSVT